MMRIEVIVFFLIIACIHDYHSRKIPNYIIILIFLNALVFNFCAGGVLQVAAHAAGSTLLTAFMFPLFKIGAMGAGDVKLIGVCSGYFEGELILLFLFFSMLISAIFSILKMINEKNITERFSYFIQYVWNVACTQNLQPYHDFENSDNDTKNLRTSICMSGPVLCSVLIHLGGFY